MDGGVEGAQIGLFSDGVDEGHDLADPVGGFGKLTDARGCRADPTLSLGGDLGGGLDALADPPMDWASSSGAPNSS